MPLFIVYDNACNLRTFCLNRSDNTSRTNIFKEKVFVVDKLHYQGHVGIECAKYCNPNLYPVIMRLHTVVVEHINSWAAPYKHSTKHMNWLRFGFFLHIIFDFYNQIKLEGLIELSGGFKQDYIRKAEKRKYEQCI